MVPTIAVVPHPQPRQQRELQRRCVSAQVQGSGFSVQGSGFVVYLPGFRVQGSGCRVQGLGFRVQGSGFRVQGSGFRVQVAYLRYSGTSLIGNRPPPWDHHGALGINLP